MATVNKEKALKKLEKAKKDGSLYRTLAYNNKLEAESQKKAFKKKELVFDEDPMPREALTDNKIWYTPKPETKKNK